MGTCLASSSEAFPSSLTTYEHTPHPTRALYRFSIPAPRPPRAPTRSLLRPQDSGLYGKVQASMKGISSLAKVGTSGGMGF